MNDSEAHACLRMISDVIEELWDQQVDLESEAVTRIRGPEPIHRAIAICEALRSAKSIRFTKGR